MSTGGRPPKKPTVKALQSYTATATAVAAYANSGAAGPLPADPPRSSITVVIFDQVRFELCFPFCMQSLTYVM